MKRSSPPVSWLARLTRRLAFDRPSRGRALPFSAALRDLDDHTLRDIGLFRERSAGPRRFDPWL